MTAGISYSSPELESIAVAHQFAADQMRRAVAHRISMILQEVQTLRTTIFQADVEELGDDDLTYQQLLGFAVAAEPMLLDAQRTLEGKRKRA